MMVTEGVGFVKDHLVLSMAQPVQVEVAVARMAPSERMVDTAVVVAL
jgi:hypothetical protein